MHKHDQFFVRCRGVIIYQGKLLVVKHEPNSPYYALPGGHMDYGETPMDCIKREIVEELGIEPVVGRLFYNNIFEQKDANKHSLELMFEITNGEDFANLEKIRNLQRSHAFEIEEVTFVGKDEEIDLRPKFAWEDFVAGRFVPNSNFSTQFRYSIKGL
jgi:ADP-ribose pyrophosphatase YjhB (NUDIX family)